MAAERDPLESLNAIERLEVGPVAVERRRLRAPYKVVQGGKVSSIDLIYRYEEDVFEPDDPASVNLASLISAQLALNYGLFTGEMIFRGPFDDADRHFLEEMARNTAREIYVKKFLEPNPFLLGPVSELQPERLDDYLRAHLLFPDAVPGRVPHHRWGRHDHRLSVLSSGGKDSTLSFAMLREIGYEAHPVFINESGRHWYTALNAFRYFRSEYPEAARVWTNSDRIFTWMLRRLPFIRGDFSRIRSDEYPVRLWTVAVFLFGALPLLRRRQLGGLVIGDEFDTTRRLSRSGITHYDGLYDQSRYFDNALTRYYMRKGWAVNQFSVVRQLSELLIEKILVERYPELQRHQLSCHAAHISGDRVLPCGRCEKCRRIVGMLVALGADPGRCGYTPEQVEYCLAGITPSNIHQEAAGVKQVLYMLQGRGLIGTSGAVKGSFRERPEVLKVRIDPERSPVEGIPVDMRLPLFHIFLDHAAGAIRRIGREWVDFDLLNDPDLHVPYPFESREKEKRAPARSGDIEAGGESSFLLGELTWPEARDRLREVDIALLPVGAIEQHGPHLPLDTDAFDAEYLVHRVAAACSDPRPLVLPLIPYGVSYHHEDFPGTVSISNETLAHLVHEIGMSAARHGIRKLIIVNAHGGNAPALQFAAQMINRDAHIFSCVDTGETSDTDISALTETPNDVHAGEVETSTALANRPHMVHLERARKSVPDFSSRFLNFSAKRRVEWYARTVRFSTSGIIGDPTKASTEKGEKMWDVMVRNLVELVEDLKGLTLSEIYDRSY